MKEGVTRFIFIFSFLSCHADVGGFFEAGTLVKYNFMPEAIAGASRDTKVLTHQLTPHEVNLTKEEVGFSFSTSSAPAVLMYVSSKTHDYLAVVLRQNGESHANTNTHTPLTSAAKFKAVLAECFGKFYPNILHSQRSPTEQLTDAKCFDKMEEIKNKTVPSSFAAIDVQNKTRQKKITLKKILKLPRAGVINSSETPEI